MKTIDQIPTGKLNRASKLIQTGAKVGINYVKYYGNKVIHNEAAAKDQLDRENASDIYDGLKTLKGSALKVAQMLSMDKNILPKAYVEQFSLSQFSVPPLSPPLVEKTFRTYMGKSTNMLFDSFEKVSTHAASIGQVHKARLNGKDLAVKIQYPGVAESISSDLGLVKPFAMKMFNIKGKESDKYFKEVENKLIEETNYILELQQSKEFSDACAQIENLRFPKYYEELSSERILTMDWMRGVHLSEFNTDDQEVRNKIGQTLWDFYMHQMHHLKKVHADPHPGNFMVSVQNELIALDFGCIKTVPDDFYIPYFELANPTTINSPELFEIKLFELEILRTDDSEEDKAFFKALFHDLLTLFTMPFHKETFDFSDDSFFGKMVALGEKYSQSTELKNKNGNRGSKHFIYINRTFFGLYNLMHDLKANQVQINNFKKYAHEIH